jgi:N-acylglucosamine 2-epimerase
MNPKFAELSGRYRAALVDDVLPFWIRHSVDREQGGFFTCLERDGSCYDTDKFLWLQARQVWTFAMLHNRLERRAEWLEVARHGVEFLLAHGRDAAGDWYFSLTREGRPLVQPYNIFSDCFAVMGLSQYALATGEAAARQAAAETFQRILQRRANPKGRYAKAVAETRPTISFSLPMILINLVGELEWLLPAGTYEQTVATSLEEVFGRFLDEESGVLHEHVAPDGRKLDTFDGRLLNPGHGIEAMWFVMDVAERRRDRALAERAVGIALRTLELGWDREHDGIFYFLDLKGRPPQQLEWDQKLWWVHVETLIALLKGYRLTGNPACWTWFERVHAYTWARFPDPKFGEWFGYLNRRGEVLLSLKGGKWKGCFHVPRALLQCAHELELLAQGGAGDR